MRIPYSLLLALGSMVIVLALTPVVIAFARRAGAMDRPGHRRIHQQATPTLGGLAIIVAVLGGAWIARALPGPAQLLDVRPLLGLTLAAAPVLVLGLVDDTRGMTPWAKLLVQIVAAGILVRFGYGIPMISNPFGAPIPSGPFNPFLTIGWVVLVMNAINLIDGLDGLAAGVVMISAITLWWVGRVRVEDFYIMFVASLVIGATVGFLRYNFPPARIFMGDTGSQFLGLVLSAVTLLEYRKGTAVVTLLFPLAAIALPLADGVLAFVRRLMSGHSVFRADSEHLHHRLLRLGLSPRNAVLTLWFLCVYLGVMAVILASLPAGYGLLLALVQAAGLVFAFGVLEFIDRRLRDRGPGGPTASPPPHQSP